MFTAEAWMGRFDRIIWNWSGSENGFGLSYTAEHLQADC